MMYFLLFFSSAKHSVFKVSVLLCVCTLVSCTDRGSAQADVWIYQRVCFAGATANIEDPVALTAAAEAALDLQLFEYAPFEAPSAAQPAAESFDETVLSWTEDNVNTTTSDGPDAVPEVSKKAPKDAPLSPQQPPAPVVPARRERVEVASPPRTKNKLAVAK